VLPFVRPTKPLAESTIALVTTGGVHLPGQARFDIDDPAGDCSYREIPAETEQLTWTHAYHRPDEGSDLDAVFPLWTLRTLAEKGVVGELNHRHFSFMGAIHDHGPLIERTAPEVAGKLADDGVDAVLLTPSCPLCHRSVGPVCEAIEERGIPTVTLAVERGVVAPRVARVPFPYNLPMGEPGDRQAHGRVAAAALGLLHELEEPTEVEIR
jgi:D-proline reductase (dithiol) PrdB